MSFLRLFRYGVFKRETQYAVRSFSTLTDQSKIGFIGLGNMGGFMAANLVKKGHPLVLCDLSPDNISQVKKNVGEAQCYLINVARSPAELADDQDLAAIITMLPSSPNVLDVYSPSKGLLSRVRPGVLLLDSTTGDPEVAKQMAVKAGEKGAVYLDAPVSGGVNAARDAILTFMVGGPSDHVERAKLILNKMGKNVFHCGPVGTGLAAKLCNNLLLAISMIGTSEAMSLGIRLGLDPHTLAGIVNSSSGRCWSSQVYNPVPGVVEGVPSGRDYQGGFGTALMTKDLGLALDASSSNHVATPLGEAAHQLYQRLCEAGYAGKDFSVVFHYLHNNQSKKD